MLIIAFPHAVRGAEPVTVRLPEFQLGPGALVLLAAMRFLTMVGSYSGGVPGGIFAPMLALAACVGFGSGKKIDLLLPSLEVNPLTFAICAMGGVLSVAVRATIVGVVLTFELTGAHPMVLPLMITCLVADILAQWAGGQTICTVLLERTLAKVGIARPRNGPE